MGISTHKTEWKLSLYTELSFNLSQECKGHGGQRRNKREENGFLKIYRMDSKGQKVVSGKTLGLKPLTMASF